MKADADGLAMNKAARIWGGFYLMYILAMVLADGLGHSGGHIRTGLPVDPRE